MMLAATGNRLPPAKSQAPVSLNRVVIPNDNRNRDSGLKKYTSKGGSRQSRESSAAQESTVQRIWSFMLFQNDNVTHT